MKKLKYFISSLCIVAFPVMMLAQVVPGAEAKKMEEANTKSKPKSGSSIAPPKPTLSTKKATPPGMNTSEMVKEEFNKSGHLPPGSTSSTSSSAVQAEESKSSAPKPGLTRRKTIAPGTKSAADMVVDEMVKKAEKEAQEIKAGAANPALKKEKSAVELANELPSVPASSQKRPALKKSNRDNNLKETVEKENQLRADNISLQKATAEQTQAAKASQAAAANPALEKEKSQLQLASELPSVPGNGAASAKTSTPGRSKSEPQFKNNQTAAPGYTAAPPENVPGYTAAPPPARSKSEPQFKNNQTAVPGYSSAAPKNVPGYTAAPPENVPGYSAAPPPSRSKSEPQFKNNQRATPGYATAPPENVPGYSAAPPPSRSKSEPLLKTNQASQPIYSAPPVNVRKEAAANKSQYDVIPKAMVKSSATLEKAAETKAGAASNSNALIKEKEMAETKAGNAALIKQEENKKKLIEQQELKEKQELVNKEMAEKVKEKNEKAQKEALEEKAKKETAEKAKVEAAQRRAREDRARGKHR